MAGALKSRFASTARSALWLLLPAYFLHVAVQTTFFQGVYIATMRDMYFNCISFVDLKYAYRMIPGECRLVNLEYTSSMSHDNTGFRNARADRAPKIAVLGDSYAYGHGVNNGETFAALLELRTGVPVRNLALPAFATRRELEAYKAQGLAADIVVIQYCDNDFDENLPSLEMHESAYQERLRERMAEVIRNYNETKSRSTFGRAMLTLGYAARQLVAARLFRLPKHAPDESNLAREADAFVRLMREYSPLLTGKRVIVLESSGWGRNRHNFHGVFARRLQEVPGVDWLVLDSTGILDRSDYFRLDDHLNAKGHGKVAAALADALSASGAIPHPGKHAPMTALPASFAHR